MTRMILFLFSLCKEYLFIYRMQFLKFVFEIHPRCKHFNFVDNIKWYICEIRIWKFHLTTIKISKFEEIIEANLKTFLPYFQQKFSRQHPRSLLINPSIRGERGQHWQTSTIFAEFFTIFPRFNNRRVFLYPSTEVIFFNGMINGTTIGKCTSIWINFLSLK